MDVCHDLTKVLPWVVVFNQRMSVMIWLKPYLQLLCWTKVHLSWSDRSLTLSCCVEPMDVCHDLTEVLPRVVVLNLSMSVMIWHMSYLELLCWTNGRLSWSDRSLTLSCCVEPMDVCHDLTKFLLWVVVLNQWTPVMVLSKFLSVLVV